MRTGDKARQPSLGRGCTAEGSPACLSGKTWAGGEHPSDCHELMVKRYPEVSAVCAEASGFAMGAFLCPWLFVCAKWGCIPKK